MRAIKFKDLIIHEDEDYLVINKPPYLSTLEDRTSSVNVLSLAREYLKNLTTCHRLDKNTSGALILSKNELAYKNIARQFENREIEKLYHAVTDGVHEKEPILIEAPLGKIIKDRVRVDFQSGKPSSTKVRTGKLFKHHTLFECKPITGRTHQIRAHLSHIGAPIVCDEKYGGQPIYLSKLKRKYNLKKGTEEQPLIARFALHARSISFKDLKGKQVEYTAEYPKDFAVLIKQLEKNIS